MLLWFAFLFILSGFTVCIAEGLGRTGSAAFI